MRIAVFASGRGTNFASIARAVKKLNAVIRVLGYQDLGIRILGDQVLFLFLITRFPDLPFPIP